ncbi:MAG: TRAP transporter small permease subunit [Planctomycetota bacterium]
MRFVALVDRLSTAVGRAAAWLGLAMVLVGAGNAVAGYLEPYVGRRLSSVAFEELQWYLFTALFLLAAPWALATGAHVRVDVLYGRLGRRGKAWIDGAGGVLLLVPFCVYGVLVTWPAAAESFRVREVSPDPGGLARWPIKALVPVAFVLLALQGIANVVRAIADLRGQAPTGPAPTDAEETAPASGV